MILRTTTVCVVALTFAASLAYSQQAAPLATPQQELERLTQAIDQTQAQVNESQRQLLELKKSLAALELRLGATAPPASASSSGSPNVPADEELQERQAMQQSQIATLDQTKVESESKYPVKISGLLLFNGFVNTSASDQPSAPSLAVSGRGNTGATLRQTILGIDARGPTLAGAASHADLRVDFFGTSTQNAYANVGGLLRFRTAHATLDWSHTTAFVELDRPIVSPNTPTSLTAMAVPALSWSGNLWTWAPQAGLSHSFDLGASTQFKVEAALIDAPDPPTPYGVSPSTAPVSSQAESSRWPGTEAHLGVLHGQESNRFALGVGGYFSPHKTPGNLNYNAWAATMDLRVPLPLHFDFTGSFYRGSSLGGLGGGAYKDYLFGYDGTTPEVIALDDVGGWVQLKQHAGRRLEFNAALGLDNAFSGELRKYAYTSPVGYQSFARNQTFFANAIYSPRAYLLFSLEYRHIMTTPIVGAAANTNVIGVAAGYRF